MTLYHPHGSGYAQLAGRRVTGRMFKIQMPLSQKTTRHLRVSGRKLTPILVQEMRQWAGGEGWGMKKVDQTKILAARYSFVSPATIQDVLNNLTWFDPGYVPGAPDLDYWGSLPPLVAMMKVMTR